MIPHPDELYDKDQAAEYLKCTVRHIYSLTSQKRITFSRIAGNVTFLGSDLIAFVKKSRVKSTADLEEEVHQVMSGLRSGRGRRAS